MLRHTTGLTSYLIYYLLTIAIIWQIFYCWPQEEFKQTDYELVRYTDVLILAVLLMIFVRYVNDPNDESVART